MKVKFLPYQPHCFAFGGFDIQMLGTSDAIHKCGVDISKLDVWSRDDDFDILHCWGFGFANYENYYWAKKSGKKLAATLLMHDIETTYAKLKFKISALIYQQRILTKMLTQPDKIALVNENQANMCNLLYKVPASKIHVIPHVVGEVFFKAQAPVNKPDDKETYILTTGNICRRKNQLMLAQACIMQGVKLVIIGKVLQGEEEYGKQLRELAQKHAHLIIWVAELKENSDELINYYRNCLAFALPSYVEQQPISMLEAAVLQKPLLTADKMYGRQQFYRNACLVNPADVNSIARGLQQVVGKPENFIPSAALLQQCSALQVGLSYQKLYTEIA